METGISIRRVAVAEAAVVKAVRLRSLTADPSSFASTHAREAAFAEDEWDSWAAGDASGEETTTLLAMRDREPVGIAAAYRDEREPNVFHLVAMWVAPDVRRAGIGRRLLGEIEAWIAASGGDCVQLSVADQALAACCLYEAAGYEPDGKRSQSPHTPDISLVSLRKHLALDGPHRAG
jgi:ribosomal protein S18 acetylase RimI-like enzyme